MIRNRNEEDENKTSKKDQDRGHNITHQEYIFTKDRKQLETKQQVIGMFQRQKTDKTGKDKSRAEDLKD